MRLLLLFLLLQKKTLFASMQLDEVEKLLEDATHKLRLLQDPQKDVHAADKEDEELLEELEDFKILVHGLCAEEVSRISKSSSSRALVGRYVPQCSSDGGYKAEQCHASTGYCWCVNVYTGQEVQGTRTRGPLHCGGLCAEEVSRISKSPSSRSLVGRYVPQCSSDGGYKAEQCHASTGYCWCVNVHTGQEIQGTRTRGPLHCGLSNATEPSAANGWSVGVTGGHSRRLGWHGGIEGRVTWGKDAQMEKPSAKNGWSVSASVGSDKDAKQEKPAAENRWSAGAKVGSGGSWSVSGSIGSDKDANQVKPSAKNGWSVSASVGSGKDEKQRKPTAENGWGISVGFGKDAKQRKPTAKNGWSIGVGFDKDAKQVKPSAKNGWSVSASVGSGKDEKQRKPTAENGWGISVGFGKDANQRKPTAKNGWSIGVGFDKDAKQAKPSAKNGWSVSGSIGSGKDEKQRKPAAANGWQILCDMTMKKSKREA